MLTASTQFESELKKLLHDRMKAIAETLTAGHAIKDFAGAGVIKSRQRLPRNTAYSGLTGPLWLGGAVP
jgi:hypothetical protein